MALALHLRISLPRKLAEAGQFSLLSSFGVALAGAMGVNHIATSEISRVCSEPAGRPAIDRRRTNIDIWEGPSELRDGEPREPRRRRRRR